LTFPPKCGIILTSYSLENLVTHYSNRHTCKMKRITYDPAFDILVDQWVNEWIRWCVSMDRRYGESPPPSIDRQIKSFKIRLSIQKDIIILDLWREYIHYEM